MSNIDAKITEKVKRFEDIKNQLVELQKQIGGLSEQQRVLYNSGLELKGQIDALVEMKADEAKALAGSKTAQLTLPEGVKPIVADAAPAADAVSAETTPAAPVALEVQ